MSKSVHVRNGKSVYREIKITQDQLDYANRVIPIEDLKAEKLKEVASALTTVLAEINVSAHDQANYALRDKVAISAENIIKMDRFFAMRQKHEDMKKIIKSCKTEEDLSRILK